MYTHQSFDAQRTVAEKAERRSGLILATVSVVLGVGQLLAIQWMDAHLSRRTGILIEVANFAAYLVVVLLLLRRLVARTAGSRPRCPGCLTPLKDMALKVASATGRCEASGAPFIEAAPR